jgi:hypothetical protein
METIAMADLGKLQGETYLSRQDARWIVQAFRELAPQVRNLGGKVFGGKVQWIRPDSDGVFAGIDAEPDFAVNAFFPIARGYKARNEWIGYGLMLAVWDEGEQRRVVIHSQASRQGDRPQASAARRKLLRLLAEADDTLGPYVVDGAAQIGDARSEGSSTQAVGSEPAAESDGFSEGDRVRLAKPFWGELDPDTGTLMKDWGGPDKGDAPTYPAGSKGTIVYPDPAPPEFIMEMKANGKYVVAMDDGRKLYAGGPRPGVEGAALDRIPGQYQVARQNGKFYLRPKFSDGDRVRLKQSFTSENGGKNYEAGWEGIICPLTVTMVECWRTGYYPVSLDDDPFGGDRGMINVPAEVIELVLAIDQKSGGQPSRVIDVQ